MLDASSFQASPFHGSSSTSCPAPVGAADITQTELARHIGCDVETINRLVNGHTSLDVAMARRLAAALGTTPEFWINLQKAVDLYEAPQEDPDLPPRLPQFEERPPIH